MRNNFKIKSLVEDPKAVDALLAFAHPLKGKLTLSGYLNCLMKDKGLTAPDVYHRADLDRQILNKLIQISNPKRASKRTLMQVCIGVCASEREATELLKTCGYAFELSVPEDQAFLFCIINGLYEMYYVYEALDILQEYSTSF